MYFKKNIFKGIYMNWSFSVFCQKMQKWCASNLNLLFLLWSLPLEEECCSLQQTLLQLQSQCLSLPSLRNLVTCFLIRRNREVIEEEWRGPFAGEGYFKGMYSLVCSALWGQSSIEARKFLWKSSINSHVILSKLGADRFDGFYGFCQVASIGGFANQESC